MYVHFSIIRWDNMNIRKRNLTKKNTMKKAIARIDFLNSIEEFKTNIPIELGNIIKQRFPITESKELISKELQIGPENEVKQLETKSIEWNFYDKNRHK